MCWLEVLDISIAHSELERIAFVTLHMLHLTTAAPKAAPGSGGQGMKLYVIKTRIRMQIHAYTSAQVKLTTSGMMRTLPTP
jgi:hypothetical protein